jgi:hypothetical protein
LINKDFYHLSAGTLEVKSNTPNNVAFKVTGKSSHEKATNGAVCLLPTVYGARNQLLAQHANSACPLCQIEAKYSDKPNGKQNPRSLFAVR